jgi:type VI protein secretion system component Hcp
MNRILLSLFLICSVTQPGFGQHVHVGTSNQPSSLYITHPSDSSAITWDNGSGKLMGDPDAIIWNRAKFRLLLDADNNTIASSQFSLFSGVNAGNNDDAPVNFNLDGGKSWINSGNFGVGTSNPTTPLEVNGMIYSNDGGIKFPDQTVQTTAALNSNPAAQAQPKLIGFLIISDLAGYLDSTLYFPQGGSFNVSGFPIYAAHQEVNQTSTQPGTTDLVFNTLNVTTDISEQAPIFFERLITGQQIDSVSLFYIQEGSPGLLAHHSIQLEDCTIEFCKNEIQSAGGGKFAHFQVMGFNYGKITWQSHTNPSNGFCWDMILQAECGSGGG